MPEDKRLWMPFPNDFWMHPKIAMLSDSGFRTFVEIIGYSRMQDLDGRIPVGIARKNWRVKALTELTTNHPERPSLSVEGDEYVIWNYAAHQETRAAREARRRVDRENGAKGGRPRKENPGVNPRVSKTEPKNNPDGTQTKPEIEIEVEIEPTSKEVGGPRKRGTRIPDDFTITPAMTQWAKTNTPTVDIARATTKFVNYWTAKAGAGAVKVDWAATWRNWMLSDAERAAVPMPGRLTPSERAQQTIRLADQLREIE